MFKAMIGAFALTLSGAAFAQGAPEPKKECCCCAKKGDGKMACCDKHKKHGHEEHEGKEMGKTNH